MATTSSAVIGLPLWNLTSWRSLKVQTVPSLLGDQLSASTGWAVRSAPDRTKVSATCDSTVIPPPSAILTGSIAAAGTICAMRTVPPGLAAHARRMGVSIPIATVTLARNGTDMPSTEP